MLLRTQIIYSLLAMVFLNAAVALGEEDPSSAKQCTSLTASGNSEYPPFLWRETSTSDDLQGVNRFFIDELSRRINIPIKLIYVGPWSRAQSEVKNGRVDLLAGAFYTNERSDYMDYFMPVILHTNSVVWQRKGSMFPFTKKEDLEGKWGVTVIDNSFGQEFDHYAQRHLNILSVSSVSQALRMLAADRVDYVLYERNPAYAYAVKLGLSDSIVPVLPYISSEGLYLTMSKRSSCNTSEIKHKIAVALQKMQQDGYTEKALIKGIEAWEKHSRTELSLK
ncbi:MAG: transporter substrate-binding domain-containing protein [Oceanospirillaceae bacterium]|nr:transporter substrate-binding domain-containing protein [Oceanospirillaceae bacterium]